VCWANLLPFWPRNQFLQVHFFPIVESGKRHSFGSFLIQDGASLAYAKDQMGHSSIQVTVDTYGHLIAGADIKWIDGLDRKTSPQPNATPAQPEPAAAEEPEKESLESIVANEDSGERGRNRTYNLLIKSQLLCQLSYAPATAVRWEQRSIISLRFALHCA
jgi:hypothetical protein